MLQGASWRQSSICDSIFLFRLGLITVVRISTRLKVTQVFIERTPPSRVLFTPASVARLACCLAAFNLFYLGVLQLGFAKRNMKAARFFWENVMQISLTHHRSFPRESRAFLPTNTCNNILDLAQCLQLHTQNIAEWICFPLEAHNLFL